MTTSTSNVLAEQTPHRTTAEAENRRALKDAAPAGPVRTLASRFIIVMLCLAMVLSAMLYGTVHYWSLALFELGACIIVLLWAVDAWRSRTLRVSKSSLQLPLIGLAALGLVQLLPLRSAGDTGGALSVPPVSSLSLDPYSTRLAVVQIVALVIYFAAALAFIDSAKRLRLLVRTLTVFGFLLALLGLIQFFTSPDKIYWLKELPQSLPFGPFYNRHHFAAYMEMAMALPLGLLFSGAIERDKRPLYIFAAIMMGIALITTGSRGGMISLVAEALFLVTFATFGREGEAAKPAVERTGRARSALLRAGLGLALVLALFGGAVLFGGEAALSRLVGTVNSDDPTTGRAHFWSMTIGIIRTHPVIGTGLGSFGLAYTQFDTRNGLFRLEQAHNDYLQVMSDAGIVGACLAVFFIIALFRTGFARRETDDPFRRGVATGALAGCFAVLIHSFFDFPLHTTANALLFLLLAAFATINGRVEEGSKRRPQQRRRRRQRKLVKQPDVPAVHRSASVPPSSSAG
ncbi:MAG TPA: O-antigen ligase family protein [Pyrinomonadaceae bacterium]|nr:O-antigen ligase family protein [Pyrinomonadaceae bacterium]